MHFERNVISHVPASEVAEDLKAIFKVRREKTALMPSPRNSSSSTAPASRRRFRCLRLA
ncbi:MAG: hypothetical protein H0V83_01450 [Rubrobacter sp.]|nr:hypothetical protein [Rubrobacter sp.]